MRYVVRFTIHNDDKFFGPGVASLLKLVADKGSLRMAANELNMAYSKAWKLVKRASDELGFKLLDSKTGGKSGGGATLTDKGRDFLNKYLEMDQKLHAHANELFKQYFPESP